MELINHRNNNGCNAYTLEVRSGNKAARGFYEKYNFQEAGIRKGYYEDNKEDTVLMWLRNE